jgi:exodeoxyribonuclease V alpha subunit
MHMAEELEGTIESILFFNPETGYSVLRFSVESGERHVVVGTFPPLSPGERLRVIGTWEVNPKFGPQLKAASFFPLLPSTAKGMEKFLSCGLVKGIGPVLAKRIVKAFGEETLAVLAEKPERLKDVEGIGAAKLAEIKKSWAEHRDVRDLIIFLQQHDVSTSLATKIYRQYGPQSYTVLKTNPYQLCLDIWGIGFKTADAIALKLGMDPASLDRIKAFLLYLLEKDNEQGHVFSYESELVEKCGEEIAAGPEPVGRALEELIGKKLVVVEKLPADTAVYRPFYHAAQQGFIRAMDTLARSPHVPPPFDIGGVIDEVERGQGLVFSATQRQAIRESFEKKVLVITGGPGTGKTTIIRAITAVFGKWGKDVILAAPTGRAAKRLSEATGREAKTIHRTLEFNPKLGTFRRDAGHPLAGEAIIIDEFSMVDLALMHALLQAVPPSMRLIVVGDKDQLPALGPGTLLRDLIESGLVSVVRLDEIFRQARDSLIVTNAHRINRGENIVYPKRDDPDSDFYFLHIEEEAKLIKTILNLCAASVPRKLGLPALSPQIQVISPMYKGFGGVERLNAELQRRLNGSSEGIHLGTRELKVHDKVMQVRNDYEKEVFNGDIGSISHIDRDNYRVVVAFDQRPVHYERDELDDLALAYAVSVHKAQGSEYQAVIMPLLTQHFIMLQRNLFYTALTRAKKLSIIIGSYKALYIAVKNDKPVKRNSLIKEKLLAAAELRAALELKGL